MKPYEYVLQELLKLPGSHTTGSVDQIRIHCPMCNHEKSKLYVGLMKDSDNLLGYDCKHCPFSGKVGPSFLKLFNIDAPDYLENFKNNKRNTKIFNPITKMTKLDLKIPNYILPEDQFKLDYLNKRFQANLTVDDLKTYKIVLNFKDLFKYNNFDYLQFEPDPSKRKYIEELADEYTKHFVGMLSIDNNKINLRNINSTTIVKRYMVHVINKNIANPYMYMPDFPIDLFAANPVFNMAEGNYDIIGVQRRFFLNNDDPSNIFVAVGTKKAYKRVLIQLIKMTGFLNAKINIFADNDPDSSLDMYRDMFKEYRPMLDEINIIYNNASKDFGDLSKPIEPVKCVI